MFHYNDHGAGIAWRETKANDENGNPRVVVKWKKGLDLPEMQKLCRELPLPYVAHFRIASGGFSKKPILTHPFPIEDQHKAHDLEGETLGAVLFHNGHWGNWKDEVKGACRAFGVRMPDGRWTDSRGMSFLANLYGYSYMELIDEKIVIFSPHGMDVINNGWVKVNDIWCSNNFFEKKTSTGYMNTGNGGSSNQISAVHGMCRFYRCTELENVVNGYCPKHAHARSGGVVTSFPTVAGETNLRTTPGTKESSRAASPFELRATLAWMEMEWSKVQEKKLKREDLSFSKQELKRVRALVAKLPKDEPTTALVEITSH
jgi:hypothetical protein